MLEVTAIFESWHIGDGNYPPFYKGMTVNLSFQMQPVSELSAASSERQHLTHLGGGEYDFCGEVIYIHNWGSHLPLAVLETTGFRFYIESVEVKNFSVGMPIQGRGTLLLDYYIWVENLDKLHDPPDIFITLEVTRIQRVKIPERFIVRHEKGKALPASVSPGDFDSILELDTMEGQKFDEEFYIVDFKEIDRRDIPRTFT